MAVTDYGDENPLLYDYYGYDREYYNLVFRSRGNSGLSNRIVQLLREAGQRARTTTDSEARGRDGRGYMGPGLDQGVFLPFRHMFGETFMNVPIAQVSLHGSLAPDKNWTLGHAIQQLRYAQHTWLCEYKTNGFNGAGERGFLSLPEE